VLFSERLRAEYPIVVDHETLHRRLFRQVSGRSLATLVAIEKERTFNALARTLGTRKCLRAEAPFLTEPCFSYSLFRKSFNSPLLADAGKAGSSYG
jgi:hypothetical protein